jgi:hypothetical protein
VRFFGIDSEIDRSKIQALRAKPPGLAHRGARRQVFGAALGQWDALLGASAHVAPAVSPILLFYALSQAGRAVCAARIRNQPWQPTGHGLKTGQACVPLGNTVIQPDGGDCTSFAMFCNALGVRRLTKPTTLSALWAANQQLQCVEGLGARYPTAIQLEPVGSAEVATAARLDGGARLYADREGAAVELAPTFSRYPHATDGLEIVGLGMSHDEKSMVEIAWFDADGKSLKVKDVAGDPTEPEDSIYLRPALNDAGDILSALGLWWVTLLALSSLARYHPEKWTCALDRDKSQTAIPIEEALSVGREMLPWLLLHVLTLDASQ